VSPSIVKFYSNCLQVVSFTLRPFYLPVATGKNTVCSRTNMVAVSQKKHFPVSETEPWFSRCTIRRPVNRGSGVCQLNCQVLLG